MDLLDVVRRTVRRYHLLEPGQAVVVGVSGGPDSLCLLHVLCELAPELDVDLHVAHLHHGLRGPEADDDAAFVAQTAAARDLACTIQKADVAALAQQPGISLEEAARNARYAFLGRLAMTLAADAVAVGHNADDQAETVLMHWLRGSGLAGLRGMTPVTQLSRYRLAGPDTRAFPISLRLVRPLLQVTRDDIQRYCDDHGLHPRFDRSNEDVTLYRNRLRHVLIPLLEGYNPQIRRVLSNTATIIADDYEWLRHTLLQIWNQTILEETPDQLIFDLDLWRDLPKSLQRGLLREAIGYLRRGLRNINFIHVENALWILREGHSGDRVTLPAGLEAVLGYHRFAVGDEGVELTLDDLPLLTGEGMALAVPGVTALTGSGWQVATALLAVQSLPAGWDANWDPWQAFLDAAVIGPRPVLRVRRDGDRFQPLGMDGHGKLVSEVFTNDKVPAAARDRWPLLVTSQGDIAWVCGLRVDERARVTSHTMDVLHVQIAPQS